MYQRIKTQIRNAASDINRFDVFDVIAFLTGTLLLLISHHWLYVVFSLSLLVAFVLGPGLRKQPWVWMAVALFWTPRLIFRWYDNEDHIHFSIFWCYAYSLALWARHRRFATRRVARILVGVAFGCAFVWKIVSPEFSDGSLFHFKLLQDYRFHMAITGPVGGMDSMTLDQNIQALTDLKRCGSPHTSVPIQFNARVHWIAHMMTWWTIYIEGLIAVLFLVPSALFDRLRNAALIVFALSTYLVVPVLGFGCLFMTLGFAQCSRSEGLAKLGYLGSLLILLISIYARALLF